MAKVGFKEIGVHEKHGKLDGVWRDCVIVERLIPETWSKADGRPPHQRLQSPILRG